MGAGKKSFSQKLIKLFEKDNKQNIIYYSDELNDDFAKNRIKTKTIDEHYKYKRRPLQWIIKHFFWYRVIALPLAWLYLKLKFHHKIVNKKVLNKYWNKAIFLYGNHTNSAADAFIPSFANRSTSTFIITHPDSVSIPIAGYITPYLGAVPLPGNSGAARNFLDIIKHHVKHRACIMIYPEAHIWPYYTKIRPFTELSFRYPVDNKAPVFCFTNTYQKRFLSKKPRIVTYMDGPFFPDENLPRNENRLYLRNMVYEAMCERAKMNNVEVIHYEKVEKDGGTAGSQC